MNNTDSDKLREAVQEIEALKRGTGLGKLTAPVAAPVPSQNTESPAAKTPPLPSQARPQLGAVNRPYPMNAKQRKILLAGIGIALLVGLFPPWTDTFAPPGLDAKITKAADYSFILSPPTAPRQLAYDGQVDLAPFHTFTIDFSRLLVQWAVVALGIWCGWVYCRELSQK